MVYIQSSKAARVTERDPASKTHLLSTLAEDLISVPSAQLGWLTITMDPVLGHLMTSEGTYMHVHISPHRHTHTYICVITNKNNLFTFTLPFDFWASGWT